MPFRRSCFPLMLVGSVVFVVCVTASSAANQRQAEVAEVDVQRDVRPILADNCFQCHGPDEAHRKAKLRLDTREGLFGGSGDERYRFRT